jgi:hypothetical protein
MKSEKAGSMVFCSLGTSNAYVEKRDDMMTGKKIKEKILLWLSIQVIEMLPCWVH